MSRRPSSAGAVGNAFANVACVALGLAAIGLGSSGCAQVWRGRGGVIEQAQMHDAYGNSIYLFDDIDPAEVGDLDPPEKLRPCCAFGSGLEVSLGKLPIHGFSLENLIGLDDLGPHKYDNGLLSLGGSKGELFSNESNGLLYSCHAGFIDSAHVRDYADWMGFFTTWIAARIETGGTIELGSEAGIRRVVLNPIKPRIIRTNRVRALSLALGEYLVYRLSIWHEIATWYGWSAMAVFPERASAFSPEDLFSNMLGIKMVRSMIEVGATGTEDQYNRNLDRFMHRLLDRMTTLEGTQAVELARALDGAWWDSTKRLPDPQLLKRRNMDIGHEVRPWRGVDAGLEAVDALLEVDCPDGQGVLVLGNPDRFGAHELSSMIRLEIEVDDQIADFPLPRPPSRVVTQDDFPQILEQIRAEARSEFGPMADQPLAGPGEPRSGD